MAESEIQRIVVYGGNGFLGRNCISKYKANNFWVASVDFIPNAEADCNVVLNRNMNLVEQEKAVIAGLYKALRGSYLKAIICVAGGWVQTSCDEGLSITTDLMYRENVWPAVLSVRVANQFLKNWGLLVLTGDRLALDSTPTMISYGLAKAAVHHLVKSVSANGSGFPTGATVVGLLPDVLDTPANRSYYSFPDISCWTPLEFVAQIIFDWTIGKEKPDNGQLVTLVTKNFNTDISVVS